MSPWRDGLATHVRNYMLSTNSLVLIFFVRKYRMQVLLSPVMTMTALSICLRITTTAIADTALPIQTDSVTMQRNSARISIVRRVWKRAIRKILLMIRDQTRTRMRAQSLSLSRYAQHNTLGPLTHIQDQDPNPHNWDSIQANGVMS